MNSVIEGALAQWGLVGARVTLVAQRENQVFRVIDGSEQSYALRLHRHGYRTDPELTAELQWMAALANGGLSVPAPVSALDGHALHRVEETQVSVLGWLDAKPLGEIGKPLDLPDRAGVFFTLGSEMAKLHDISDRWTPPGSFRRWSWDRDGLLGDQPLWDRFWENPTLSEADRSMLTAFRRDATATLAGMESTLDYGLIHADLVPENVMRSANGALYLIDFDDGGYGFRLFDIATAIIKHRAEPDFEDLRAALIDGYLSKRKLDMAALDLFMALRAVTYVGWIIQRMGEDRAALRNERFLAQAREMISKL